MEDRWFLHRFQGTQMESRRDFLRLGVLRLLALRAMFGVRANGLVPGIDPQVDLSQARYVSLIATLVRDHQFDPATLRAWFSKAALKPKIIEILDRPPETLAFYQYRERFINDALIERGRSFLAENRALLLTIEAEFGVDHEIICGILGVETKFGQPGLERYRAFDVLNTIFALYPRREEFYRNELIQFMRLCRDERLDPLAVNSSYAGAIGMPQFIPSSFQKYAIDYDRDGKRDLWAATGDICASVANYLKAFGWRKGGLRFLPARLTRDTSELREKLGVRKILSVAEAAQLGIDIQAPTATTVDKNDEVSFASYEPQAGEERWLALFDNFRALLNYNFSVNYALTLIDLSRFVVSGTSLPKPGSPPPSPAAVSP